MGTMPIIILTPFTVACLNACKRVNVPGNKTETPIKSPAAPEIIIAKISSVPCIHIVKTESSKY